MAHAYEMTGWGRARSRLVITCEHASNRIPTRYRCLGVPDRDLADHIAWDIGAATLTRALSRAFRAPAVLAKFSRLVVDANRAPDAHDVIVEESDGRRIPGNIGLALSERLLRLTRYHAAYHAAVDRCLRLNRPEFLLSVHSFTPVLAGSTRDFDLGVLFDHFEDLAKELAAALSLEGFSARLNQPYSGREGLIYSAARHGSAHGIPYLELEVNQRLLRDERTVAAVAAGVARSLHRLLCRIGHPRAAGGRTPTFGTDPAPPLHQAVGPAPVRPGRE